MKNNKKGFTLVEVLLTLVAIGIVAAITVPAMVETYARNALYSQFRKTYNNLTTAAGLAFAKYGNVPAWGIKPDAAIYENQDVLNRSFISFLKIQKQCDVYTDCFHSGFYSLSIRKSQPQIHPTDFESLGQPQTAAVMADGSSVIVYASPTSLSFLFDTNGTAGPNAFGRDIFTLSYALRNGAMKIVSDYSNICVGTQYNEETGEDEQVTQQGSDDDCKNMKNAGFGDVQHFSNCMMNTSISTINDGSGCAAKLIVDGKMKY